MKKGDIIEGTIEQYSFPNRGSFRYEDRKIIVKNALPGAKVRVRITKKKTGYAEGMVLDTLKTSPYETKKPVCPHFYECGGCTYQTVAYTNQLRLKEQMVKDILTPVVPDLPWEGIAASPDQFQYRNKMEFSFGDAEKDGPLTLGLHRLGSSYDILEIRGCALVRPAWNEILKYTQKFFRDHKVSFYHKMQHYGILRHLVVRQSFADGGILVNLVTTTKYELQEPDRKKRVQQDMPAGMDAAVTDMTGITAADGEDMDLAPDVTGGIAAADGEDMDLAPDTTGVNAATQGTDVVDRKTGTSDGLRNQIIQDLHLPEYVAGLVGLEASGKFDTLTSHNHLAGVIYTENDSLADAVKADSVTLLYGQDYLMEEVLGLQFRVSPFSFFQTNTRGCEVLYSKVREYVLSVYGDAVGEKLGDIESDTTENAEGTTGGDTNTREKTSVNADARSTRADGAAEKKAGVIYDLYSGTGTIAQLMAPIAKKVYGIEIVEEAVEAARANAKLNKLKNCEFIAGDVLQKLDEIQEKPDFIILDPPRDGCTPKALDKIIDYGVPYMVYISCKPTSLARDLVTLQARGYRVSRACAADEFPNTQHVECILLLQRMNKTTI